MVRSEATYCAVKTLQDEGVLLVEDGNHGDYRPRPDEFRQGTTKFIRAADLSGERVLFDSADHIGDRAVQRIRKGIGRSGDIIFSHKGTVGKIALAEEDSPPFVCSPQTTFWRVLDSNRLDRHYLYYFMQSEAFRRQWLSRKGETDMADYVSLTTQRQFLVFLLEIDEQRAIGRFLGALDEKIELNRHVNRTLESLAQAIFRSWFVDFDPVVAKADGREPFRMAAEIAALFPERFVDSEVGPIPESWSVGSLMDLARYVNGRNFTRSATGTGRMVLRIAELNSGPGLSTIFNDVKAPSEYIACPDDILFSWSGSLGVYRWHDQEALINQHIFKVICDEYPKWFAYFHLLEALSFLQNVAADKATTMGHIKRGHLTEVKMALPPHPLLREASSLIGPLYGRTHLGEIESLTLASLRDLLIPKLLSGQIGLREAEKAVEQVL